MSAPALLVTTKTPAVAVAAGTAENLDERMERIRRRNEELEQKHREAEADRLAALKNNAMVVTTRPTIAGSADDDEDDDWPRAHRYDTFEFAYESTGADGKSTTAAAAAKSQSDPSDTDGSISSASTSAAIDAAGKEVPKGPGGRDYKKFAVGEGPPPDPSFNFLADAERDGRQRRKAAAAAAAGGTATTPTTPNVANANERSNKDWRSQQPVDDAQRPRGGLNGSFKAGGGQQRAGSANNNARGRAPRTPTNANNVDDQWKTERERIDEARIGRQMMGDGKWRREWDNEKVAVADAKGGQKQTTAALAAKMDNLQIEVEQPVTTTASAGRRIVANQNVNNNAVERRGNLTVSLSKDGEVKSVKLQTNRAIGTGRVGTRGQLTTTDLPTDTADPFPIISSISPRSSLRTQHETPTVPPQPHPYYHQNHKPLLPHSHPAKPQPVYIQPTPTVYFDNTQLPPPQAPVSGPPLLPLTANAVPPATRQFLDSRPKLQDRLARHRQPTTADATG